MVTIEIYEAGDGWRWRMKRKGRIVADSGEAYSRSSSCVRAVNGMTRIVNFRIEFV